MLLASSHFINADENLSSLHDATTNTQDVILGLGFLLLAAASLKRLLASAGQRGSETVITTFYSLILFTSAVRALWFLIPTKVRRMIPMYRSNHDAFALFEYVCFFIRKKSTTPEDLLGYIYHT